MSFPKYLATNPQTSGAVPGAYNPKQFSYQQYTQQQGLQKYLDQLHTNPNSLSRSDMGGVGDNIASVQIDPAAGGAFGGNGWFSKEGLFGGHNADGTSFNGWGSTAVGLGSGLLNAYLGYKNLGVMEDSLKFQKNAFSKQFENQRKTTNAALRDRQQARYDSDSGRGNVMSVDEYMKLNGV